MDSLDVKHPRSIGSEGTLQRPFSRISSIRIVGFTGYTELIHADVLYADAEMCPTPAIVLAKSGYRKLRWRSTPDTCDSIRHLKLSGCRTFTNHYSCAAFLREPAMVESIFGRGLKSGRSGLFLLHGDFAGQPVRRGLRWVSIRFAQLQGDLDALEETFEVSGLEGRGDASPALVERERRRCGLLAR